MNNVKIREFINNIIENLAYDVIKKLFIIMFPSGISFGVFYNALKSLEIPTLLVILFSSLVAVLITFIFFLIYKNYFYTDDNFSILHKTVKFTYDETKSYYESEMELKFKKKTREYYGTFYWSGSGEGKIETINPNFTLNILKKRSSKIEYVVVFDRTYKKGDKLTLKLKGQMEDPDKRFMPYFSTTVNFPTNKMSVILNIDPEKYPIVDLEKEIISPPPYKEFEHKNIERIQLDYDGNYKWDITNPVISYKYSINWSFKP